MLEHRTFRGTEAERQAVTALLEEHTGDGHASVTRTEAQEAGPLRLETPDGKAFLVHPDGSSEVLYEDDRGPSTLATIGGKSFRVFADGSTEEATS